MLCFKAKNSASTRPTKSELWENLYVVHKIYALWSDVPRIERTNDMLLPLQIHQCHSSESNPLSPNFSNDILYLGSIIKEILNWKLAIICGIILMYIVAKFVFSLLVSVKQYRDNGSYILWQEIYIIILRASLLLCVIYSLVSSFQ